MAQKIETNEIAKRYATALLQHAIEQNSVDAVMKDVDSVRDVLSSSDELSNSIKSPAVSREDAKAVLFTILDKIGVCDGVKGLANVLCDNRRAFALATTLDTFEKLVQEYKGIIKAEVISATELSNDNKTAVADAVAKAMSADVQISHFVDSSIIGGLIVKIGSKMLDASVQTKLEKLKLEMKGV